MKDEELSEEFDGYASEQEQEAERLIASLPDSREGPADELIDADLRRKLDEEQTLQRRTK